MNKRKLDNLFKQARVVAENSPDAETQVGCLLVSKSSGAVLGSGYNGFIRGANDKALPSCRPEKYEYITHSEANLIYHCARHGIAMCNCFVIVTLSPCKICMRALYQSGITEIYFDDEYKDFNKQISMKDIQVDTEELFGYTKIKLSPKRFRYEGSSV